MNGPLLSIPKLKGKALAGVAEMVANPAITAAVAVKRLIFLIMSKTLRPYYGRKHRSDIFVFIYLVNAQQI